MALGITVGINNITLSFHKGERNHVVIDLLKTNSRFPFAKEAIPYRSGRFS
jgi:hypothetical protein